MGAILELLLDLFLSFWPWSRGSENRSVVGDSDLDRQSRLLWIWIAVVVLVCIALSAILYHLLRTPAP